MEFKQLNTKPEDNPTIELTVQDTTLEQPPQNLYGRSYAFLFRDSVPLITLGPHWYIFVLTFLMNIYLQVFFLTMTLFKTSILLQIIQVIYGLLQVLSYLAVAITNPGIITASTSPSNHNQSLDHYCQVCKIMKARTTEHCDFCKTCIEEYDHHCPWVGKCIGKGNACEFKLFLFMTFSNLLFLIVPLNYVNK